MTARRFILRTPDIRARAAEFVAGLPVGEERPLEVVVGAYKRRRSLSQNRTFHMWVTEIANTYEETHGERIAPEAWKAYLKGLFLGEASAEVMGKVVTTTRHTADLSVSEFMAFLDAVDRWAVDNLQAFLPRGPDYEEAFGRAA